MAKACGEGTGHRPSVFHHACSAREDQPVVIGTVAHRIGGAYLMAEVAGPQIVIACPGQVAKGKCRQIEVRDVFRITEDMVQTAPLGIGGPVRNHAVHRKTVQHDILVLVVQASGTEVGDAESVGGVVDIHILT